MAREKFRTKRWRPDDLELVAKINELLETYAGEGVEQVTLRTAYYGLVKQNIIPNDIKQYARLGDIVTDARMCGLLDWDSIVDLGRRAIMPSQWDTLGDLVESAISSYRLPRWEGQDNYVEVCVEKEGMTVSIEPVTRKWHVRLVPNKGYGSTTALYDMSKRFLAAQEQGLQAHILYLGDHDPSGLDMDRDIEDRLRTFGVEDLEVERIALTTPQVRQYNPPPNPAKMKDSRAKKYIDQFGRVSWEVNALSPGTLNKLIETRLKSLIDMKAMKEIIEKEDLHKERMQQFAKELEDEGG